MEGRTRDEVEEYLAQSFGRDDAARVADEVFRTPGPAAPPAAGDERPGVTRRR